MYILYIHIYIYIYCIYKYRYIYINIGSRLGSPALPGTLSLVMYYKRCYGIEMGGGGWGGCNNVMWTALDWDLLKPWGCCFAEEDVTLQVSLLFTEGGGGGGLDSALHALRLHREKTNGALAPSNCFKKPLWTWRWKRCDVHVVHGSPVNFSSCQQNDQKCMKPHFEWSRCCTHVWPSMEDVNLSFFCADKRRVYPRRHCNFYWPNNLREEQKKL